MGPPENPTPHPKKRVARRPRGAPRARRCLLKGCERRFHPEHARQRYCSGECREAAREWSEWRARQTYRATAAGKQKRNGQSGRYRKRVKDRKPPEKGAVPDAARVIPRIFFRWLLRPARLLRMLRALAAIAAATVLLACLPARGGARLGTRAALATQTRPVPPFSWKAAPGAAAVRARRTPR
jgi:hypothetical protein